MSAEHKITSQWQPSGQRRERGDVKVTCACGWSTWATSGESMHRKYAEHAIGSARPPLAYAAECVRCANEARPGGPAHSTCRESGHAWEGQE